MFVMTGSTPGERPKKSNMMFSVGPKKDTPREHYRVCKHDIKYMKQPVVAFVGKYVVISERDEFWGGDKSKTYQSAVLFNPTWGRLFTCAKAAQLRTNDWHHAFFEGAYNPMKDGKGMTVTIKGEEVLVLRLALGS